jgi:hypothetical protein
VGGVPRTVRGGRRPELVEATLAYALAGPLRARELWRLLREVEATADDRDRRYRFLTANYAAIAARLPADFAAFLPYFAAGCEPDRVAAARAFFADPTRSTAATRSTLDQVADLVAECARLREREGDSVAQFLVRIGASP